jgi:predicted dehydrogenase
MSSARRSDRVRAAVVGCGNIGSDYDRGLEDEFVYSHAKAFLLNPHTDLVAACDISDERRARFRSKWGERVRVFDDPAEMLATAGGLDVISICTPTACHEADLLRILETDIPYVLCEKPLVGRLDTFDEIVGRYAKAGKTLLVNHVLRWEPGILRIKEELAASPNTVEAVHVVYAKGLQHNGLHAVDLSLFLFGEPLQVFKVSQFEELPGDPTCSAVFVYPDFSIHFSGLPEKNYSIFEYTIYGSESKITITDLTTRIARHSRVDHRVLTGYRHLSGEPEEMPCRQHRNMENVINDVVEGIRSDDPRLFRCTAADARLTMGYLQRIAELPCLTR